MKSNPLLNFESQRKAEFHIPRQDPISSAQLSCHEMQFLQPPPHPSVSDPVKHSNSELSSPDALPPSASPTFNSQKILCYWEWFIINVSLLVSDNFLSSYFFGSFKVSWDVESHSLRSTFQAPQEYHVQPSLCYEKKKKEQKKKERKLGL